MVMMADYFATLEDPTADPQDRMRTLAGNQPGRDQLAWARWWMLDGSPVQGPEPAVSEAAKSTVRDRYFRLSATNVTHFSAGGTAASTYEHYHSMALDQAFRAGQSGLTSDWTVAMTTEAFGAHFLTDMFSAGHVRTPRVDIRAWYGAHMPHSTDQFVAFMAREMHSSAVQRHPWANRARMVPSEADMQVRIRSLGGSALNAFSLGDIVSLAIHDRDSQGLDVVSAATTTGFMPATGYHWHAVGDNLMRTSTATRDMAVAALRFSLQDLDRVRTAGLAAASPFTLEEVARRKTAALAAVTPYVALSLVPRADTAHSPVVLPYEWGSFNTETRAAVDRTVRGEIAHQIEVIANRQADADQRAILLDFVALLRARGIRALEDAVGVPAGGTIAPAAPAPVPATP
jgi:hypothetical protein